MNLTNEPETPNKNRYCTTWRTIPVQKYMNNSGLKKDKKTCIVVFAIVKNCESKYASNISRYETHSPMQP